MEPLGLHLTPDEVRAIPRRARLYDIQTAYGRFRISNSRSSPAPGGRYLLQVGASLDPMDAALGRYLDLLLWRALPSLLADDSSRSGGWPRRALAPLTATGRGSARA